MTINPVTNDVLSLQTVIQEAFSVALAEDLETKLDLNKLGKRTEAQYRNNERSKKWVSALSNSLLNQTQRLSSKVVTHLGFHKGNSSNKKVFGLNEFLFDIVIAEMVLINSAGNGNPKSIKKLEAIKKVKWVVESEFCGDDSKKILLDLNKLILAKADNKLLVISCTSANLQGWTEQVLEMLSENDDANIYLAAVPHPNSWGDKCESDTSVIKIK